MVLQLSEGTSLKIKGDLGKASEESLITAFAGAWHDRGIMTFRTMALWGDMESDIVEVTNQHYVNEVEVKISLRDLKADFKKEVKHRKIHEGKGPNRFSYLLKDYGLACECLALCTGKGLGYGIYHALPSGKVVEMRGPKMLHREKAGVNFFYALARSMTFKQTL